MTDCTNGTPGAANPLLEARDKARRTRTLVNQIAARQPTFRGLLRAQSRDLAELLDLTGVVDVRTLACLDSLDRDITDLLYWASGGKHDAHTTASKPRE